MQKALIDREDILNYELNIIEKNSKDIIQPTITQNSKYEIWQLDQKLINLNKQKQQIRWIGNHQKAYLDAYAYVLLIGSLHLENNFIQFKGIIYSFAKKCLDIAEQKLLVEFLCLIQFSKDKHSFLKKYPHIEEILIKILQFLEVKDAKLNHQNNEKKQLQIPQTTKSLQTSRSYMDKKLLDKNLKEIYTKFSENLHFISLVRSYENAFIFKLFNTQEMCIVIEKQCFFMIQSQEMQNCDQNWKQMEQQSNDLPFKKSIKGNHFDIEEFEGIYDFKQQNSNSKMHQFRRNFETNLKADNQSIFSSIKRSTSKAQSSNFFNSNFNNRSTFDKMWPRTETDQAMLADFINEVNANQLQNGKSFQQETIQRRITVDKKQNSDQNSYLNLSKKQKKQKLIAVLKEKSVFFNKIKEQIEQFRKKLENTYEKTQKYNSLRKRSLNYVGCEEQDQLEVIKYMKAQNGVNPRRLSQTMSLKDIRGRKESHVIGNYRLNPSKLENICENQENVNLESTPPSFENKKHLSEKSLSPPSGEEVLHKLSESPDKKRNFQWLKSSKKRLDLIKPKKEEPKVEPANQKNININLSFKNHILSSQNPYLSLNSSPAKKTPLKQLDSEIKKPANAFRPLTSYAPNINFCQPSFLHHSFSKDTTCKNTIKFS